MQEVMLVLVSVFYCIAETIKMGLKRALETCEDVKVVELEGTNKTRQTVGVEILSPVGVSSVQLAMLNAVRGHGPELPLLVIGLRPCVPACCEL